MAKQVIYMWIDFTSPMSYVAYTNMRKALEAANRDDLVLNLKTYQLDPDLDVFDDNAMKEAKKEQRAQKRLLEKPRIAKLIKQSGVKFNFKKLTPVNTVNPHRLLQLAKTFDDTHKVANALAESLFKAYFVDNKDISIQDELVKIAITHGIDEKAALNVFDAEKYLEMLFLDEQEGIDDGILGAPFISFPNKTKISGALSVKQATDFINQIPLISDDTQPEAVAAEN